MPLSSEKCQFKPAKASFYDNLTVSIMPIIVQVNPPFSLYTYEKMNLKQTTQFRYKDVNLV